MISQVGVEKTCSGIYCDGQIDSNCGCIVRAGTKGNCLAFAVELKYLSDVTERIAPYFHSLRLTKTLFSPAAIVSKFYK